MTILPPTAMMKHALLLFFPLVAPASYLRRRASRSDSKRHKMSSSRTIDKLAAAHFIRGAQTLPGPLTLRMIERVVSSINSTRTCVTPPREPFFRLLVCHIRRKVGTVQDCVPVRPRTRVTLTSLTGTLEESIGATDRIEEDV
jgi:hypothetical protein